MDAKASLGLSVGGLVFLILSIGTVYWSETEELREPAGHFTLHSGLWKTCKNCVYGPSCKCSNLENDSTPDWLKATQASICLAFIAQVGSVLCLAFLTCAFRLPEKLLKILSLVFLGIAIFWTAIGIIVYAAKYNDLLPMLSELDLEFHLRWSWGMAILTLILQICGFVLVVFSNRASSTLIGITKP